MTGPNYPEKDLTSADGLTRVMEYETLSYEGEIKSTWMEYVTTAFYRVNDLNAKKIVLYLCKNRHRQVTRKELMDRLTLDMTDIELEKKLKALVMADIINQGKTNFDYRAVEDNIFDKVFRGVYQKEIQTFDEKEITNEYKAMFKEMNGKYNKLLGEYNYTKGYFAEYLIINRLKFDGVKKNDLFKSITRNLPVDFKFAEYERVWKYRIPPDYARELDVDIFAKAADTEYSIIAEVKNRNTKKFSIEEANKFQDKMEELKKIETIKKSIGFIFSRIGFTEEAEEYCRKNLIAYSSDERWLY